MTSGYNVNTKEVMDEKSTDTLRKRYSILSRQLFASSASILCAVSVGTVIGYSAILLPQVRDDGHSNFTSEEESWIASSAALSMAPSCILGGLFMETYGRKLLNIFVNIPFLIGWSLMYLSNGFHMFFWGRILQGISLGISGPLNSVFIGETSEPLYRGIFLAGVSLGYTFGIFVSHLFGTYFRWKSTIILCSSINVLTLVLFIMVPESPPFLLAKGKVDEAYKAFVWLRGEGKEAATEFGSMMLSRNDSEHKDFKTMLLGICQSNFYRPLFVLVSMFFLLQFVGVNVVAFYTVSIMKETVGYKYDEYLAMIIIDIVRFSVAITTCIVVKKYRRRPLFLFSGIGTGICLIAFAIYLFLSQSWVELKGYPFIPMLLIMGYICFSSFGLLPLPWCLIGEIFPFHLRGVGSGIASASNFIFFFTTVKIAPFMFSLIGMDGSFLIFGLIGLIGTPMLYFALPETHNKTLQEIEDDIAKSKA